MIRSDTAAGGLGGGWVGGEGGEGPRESILITAE
jgi:hypothetical protein